METPWRIFEETQPVKLYAKNQMIYLQEETAIRFYYLKKGRVKIFLSSPDGLEKTLAVLQPGSLFGEASFFDGKPRVSSAKTLEKSEILSIDRSGLEHCFHQEPQLAFHLLRHLSGTIRMLSAQVDSMAFLQADARLAQLLLSLAEDNRVPLTHEELAGLAAVSRITVSRILSRWARQGWIATGYREVLLYHPQALARIVPHQTLY